MTIDPDGLDFGLLDPPPQTVTSTYETSGIVFEELNAVIGDIKATMPPTGDTSCNIQVVIDNTPLSGLGSLEATDSIDANTLHLGNTIRFSDGSSASGVLDPVHVT